HFVTTTADYAQIERPVLKLIDFGACSRTTKPAYPTYRCLTPRYAAPEALAGAQRYPASDLYSFGLVLLECLGFPKTDHNSDTSSHESALKSAEAAFPSSSFERALVNITSVLLTRDPQLRPPSAAWVSRQLIHLGKLHRLPVWNVTPWADCLRSPVMVGLNHIDRYLDAHLESSSTHPHTPHTLYLTGPPGSGKTTLLRAFAHRCFSRGMTGYIELRPGTLLLGSDAEISPDVSFHE